MSVFNLKLKFNHIVTPRWNKKSKKREILKKSVKGEIQELIVSSTGGLKYVVLSDGNLYDIHPKSFDNEKKKVLYVKDDNGNWIEVIRVCTEDRRRMPTNYLPFRPGLLCYGNIIENDNESQFVIKSCWKPYDTNGESEAIKEVNES